MNLILLKTRFLGGVQTSTHFLFLSSFQHMCHVTEEKLARNPASKTGSSSLHFQAWSAITAAPGFWQRVFLCEKWDLWGHQHDCTSLKLCRLETERCKMITADRRHINEYQQIRSLFKGWYFEDGHIWNYNLQSSMRLSLFFHHFPYTVVR